MLKSAIPSVGSRLPHLCRTSPCLPRSCCRGWGGFSPAPPGSPSTGSPPGKQLTGTQTASQMMDPYQENQTWQGEVRLLEWPPLNLRTRGRCGQLPRLSVCTCVSVCACTDMLYVSVCVSALMPPVCGWLVWHVFPFVKSLFFTFSIWTWGISLAVDCNVLFWKLTKYQPCFDF